jgi:hypothetical protein
MYTNIYNYTHIHIYTYTCKHIGNESPNKEYSAPLDAPTVITTDHTVETNEISTETKEIPTTIETPLQGTFEIAYICMFVCICLYIYIFSVYIHIYTYRYTYV